MKKNKLFILAFAACAALLSACSTELGTTDNPNHAGAGEAIVSVSLQFPQADKPAGYADVPADVALDAEKEIKSIAFIAFVKGQASIFLSTNPPLDLNGFTDPLTPVSGKVGEYTAKFKILASDFSEKETIVAVANFDEHGLTFSPDLTLDDLKKKLSDKLLDEADKNFIDYPLLMAVVKDELEITEGQEFKCDFEMTRIMARVDVVNKAYVKDAPQDGFVLTSARLISAPTEGTMIAGQTVTTPTYLDLLEQTDVTDIAAVTGDNPTPARQELASMYVYENTNQDKDEVDATKLSATATYVEVKGTYKGATYTKQIPFKTIKKIENNVNVGGEVVPIVRNTRYLVQILPSESTTDPNFELAVKNWDNGDDLDVQVDFDAPVFEGLDNPTVGAGATWEVVDNPDGSKTRTLNITNATAGTELEFLVRGYQDTDFTVETEYDENEIKVINGITVDPGVLSGYADGGSDAPKEEAPLARTYKVKIPQAVGEFPSLTKIIVYNAAYADARTEITVKYAPMFIGDFKNQGATFDPKTRLIDLKNEPNDKSGTVSFLASSNVGFEDATIENKGLTANFYSIATADENDIATLKKYGPGKRVTLSYQALTNNIELAEVRVKETGAEEASAKKLFVKCLKNTYFESVELFPNADNTLVEEGTKKIYLAVNNGEHGTLEYTVYDDATNTIVLEPSATYAVTSSNPDWVKGVSITENTVDETYPDYQIVKRTVKVALPKAIKNPSAVINFKVGENTTAAALLQLSPVYLAGTTITAADKAFAPVCVKDYWWAPINIGQTKISTINNPSSEGGYIYQWGRKRGLTWDAPTVDGQKSPNDPVVMENKFISYKYIPDDWRTPSDDKLWNSGTEAEPKKAVDNDPCPPGWRVPTGTEWNNSITGTGTPPHIWQGSTSPGSESNGLLTVTGEENAQLFLPATGCRTVVKGNDKQGTYGQYMTSSTGNYDNITIRSFSKASVFSQEAYRTNACPVRCVQE